MLGNQLPETIHVVGIGASAGGLEAIKLLLANLKKTGKFVFVVAQHMSSDGHTQLMARLMGRESALPVSIINPNEALEADRVYLIPAGYDCSLEDGRFKLTQLTGKYYSKPSIDFLFNSIASACGSRAVGVILSGSGTDGVKGCLAIKAHGGLVVAQDPATAVMDAMPVAAIESGAVEHIVAPSRLGWVLFDTGRTQNAMVNKPAKLRYPVSDAQLARLIEIVLHATGVDFSCYKEETLIRRLNARMSTLKIADVDDYLAYILSHRSEANMIQQAFLVSMSFFFRDRASFDFLRQQLAVLIQKKIAGESIRVWVPGCAAGEECYSLAILLKELQAPLSLPQHFTIIGNDLNADAIDKARQGWYRSSSFKEMNQHLVAKYFIKDGDGYRISKDIKSLCEFRHCDVFKMHDETLFDLISCRNLLIYLKAPLQNALVKKFHQLLKPDGLLFLGQSENVGEQGVQLFTPLTYYHRLFRSRPA